MTQIQDTVALHYQQVGQGKPIVILHGLMGSADNWRTLGLRMGEQLSVYMIDQRNHGHSPHTEVWDYPHMAADVVRLIEEQNLGPVTLMGHSMGGKTAMYLAAYYPHLVERLIVVDMASRENKRGHDEILAALNAADIRHTDKRHEVEAQLMQGIPEASTRQFIMKALYREGEGFAWRFNLKVITEQYDHILQGMDGNPVFDKPTLFVKGELSNYIRVQDWSDILELFPQADLAVIDGAGHWVHAEAPNAFLDAVGAFMGMQFSHI